MSKILQIIKKNNQTFYDYRTEQPRRFALYFRLLVFAAAASLFGCSMSGGYNDAINAVITVQSILIGFSFSVTFYLISSEGAFVESPEISLEGRVRNEKYSKLSREIFYNLLYFNIVAALCLLFSLIYLFEDAFYSLGSYVAKIASLVDFELGTLPDVFNWDTVIRSLMIFFLLESSYTFFRTILRVNFLFDKKIEMNQGRKN